MQYEIVRYNTLSGRPFCYTAPSVAMEGLRLSDVAIYRIISGLLIMVIVVLLFVLLILKSLSVVRFSDAPLLYSYSILIMTFQMSRITAALLYRSHAKEVKQLDAQALAYQPRVTFIIPCKNEETVIFENIEHCYNVDYPQNKLEVIVINDGSTDKTIDEIYRAKAQFPGLGIINWKVNRGKRRAMAAAIKHARGQIVIQLDSDSYIEAKDFRKLILPFRNSHISAVCAHADPSNKDENLLTKAQAAYYFMAFRILKAAESTFNIVLCCSGCCSAYRRSTVLPLIDEFANEKFLGVHVNFGDDRSLTNLIIKHGHKTVYVSNVQAYTIVPASLRHLIKQQVRWKKSWFINTTKASRYIWKNDAFVALTYFYPLALITLITPFMAIYGLIVYPLLHQKLPLYFLAGSLLVTTLFALISRVVARDNRHWFYLPVWAAINTTILTFILPYALITIRNTKWGTR